MNTSHYQNQIINIMNDIKPTAINVALVWWTTLPYTTQLRFLLEYNFESVANLTVREIAFIYEQKAN